MVKQLVTLVLLVLTLSVGVTLFLAPRDAAADASPTGCYVAVFAWTYDDIRAGNADVYARVEFWRGEQVDVRIAGRGVRVGDGPKGWRAPAPPPRGDTMTNGIRRITLFYSLDGGDGLLLQPDTWDFQAFEAQHYCSSETDPVRDVYLSRGSARTIGPFPPVDVSGQLGNQRFALSGRGQVLMFEARGPDPGQCTRDSQCDDRLLCNGTERCAPAAPGADVRGCVSGRPVSCPIGQKCADEPGPQLNPGCVVICSNPDADRDGFTSIACGGDDCDDTNRNIRPGGFEFWQPENIDEDCDLATMGAPAEGAAMTCDGSSHVILPRRLVTVNGRSTMLRTPCPSGTVCLIQPSNEAICVPAFSGYVAPPRFNGALLQREHPPVIRPTEFAPPRPVPPVYRR